LLRASWELPHEVDPRRIGRVGHFVIPFAKAQGARVLTDAAAEALASVEQGHSVGKVVLKVA
jgi:hypothetical protein